MQCYYHPVISFAKIEYLWYLFFPLGLSCTDGENNCAICTAEADMCEICESGFTADVNGVCQGKRFVYTILLSHPTITYITVLVYFPFTRFGPLWRSIPTKYICIFGDLHAV